ncbi:hypothetical protein [Moorena producens]|nr:hypothetical protein [Moorena producens]
MAMTHLSAETHYTDTQIIDDDFLDYPYVDHICLQLEEVTLGAYTLDNQIVFSLRQMSIPIRQSPRQAQEFLEENGYPKLWVTAPSQRKLTVYPINSLLAYWKYLVSDNLIPAYLDKNQTVSLKQLIEQLEKDPNQLIQPRVNLINQDSDWLQATPTRITIGQSQLEILKTEDDQEFRVSLSAAMDAIGSSVALLVGIINSRRKLKKLKAKGFSGKILFCYTETQGIMKTMSLGDCLQIWEYFALKGNTKAVYLLSSCSKLGINSLLEFKS